MKSYYQILLMLFSALLYLALVMSPPLRIVLPDGFNALVTGELLQSGTFTISEHSRVSVAQYFEKNLASHATVRRERVPIPKFLGQEEIKLTSISANSAQIMPLRSGEFIYGGVLNGTVVYALFWALGIDRFYALLIILPVLLLSVYTMRGILHRQEQIVFFILFLFNPVVLFFSCQASTIDICNLLLSLLLMVLCIKSFKGGTISGEKTSGAKRVTIFIVLGFIGSVSFFHNPLSIGVVFLCGFFSFVRGESGRFQIMGPTLYYGILAVSIFFLLWLNSHSFMSRFLPFHPLAPYLGPFKAFFQTGEMAFPLVVKNVYSGIRALILIFPALFFALFGIVGTGDRRIRLFLITSLCLYFIPACFTTDLDFSLYQLYSRFLLSMVPMLLFGTVLWLQKKSPSMKGVLVATIVIIGISSHAFFLARMRIDLFHSGIMGALDKNTSRMYLVYQEKK